LLANLFSALPARAQSPALAWQPQKTYALLVGVLKWQDADLPPFSNVHRKDQELQQTLLARGTPADHILYLSDAQATLAKIRATFAQLAAAAPTDATFIFYYAGHGVRDDSRETYLANFDINSSKPQKTGFNVSEVGQILAANFKGKNIFLFADNCYSGALAAVAKQLGAQGFKVVSLTSAQSANTSTGNWTFTQTLLDSLRGEPLNDANGDGQITLKEVATAEADAMKYREWQMNSFANLGLPDNLTLAVAKAPNPALATQASEIPIGSYVEFNQDGEWVAARVLSRQGNQFSVQLYDYSDYQTLPVPLNQLRKFAYDHYEPGTKVKVLSEDQYCSAKIVARDGDFHLVTYTDWDSSWDEWVLSDRIKK
jgi:hypothetical protein